MDQKEFKRTTLLPYFELKGVIRKDNKALREKRKRAKELEKSIQDFMQEKNVKKISSKNGTLEVTQKKTIAPLKKEFLIQQLKDRVQMDEANATALVKEILDARPVSTSEQLSLNRAK